MARRYNLPVSDILKMHHEQGGRCAICGVHHSELNDREHFNLFVDHDHETGIVRGLLCTHCNVGLGHFRDSPNLLAKAIAYLGPRS